MTVSVIVATYNRASLLDECLDHLARQPFGAGDELIVVDNGSTDETRAVLERHRFTFPGHLTRLEEPRAGKSHALTSALSVATGDILAFTDDDVNVAPGWLESVRVTMADASIGLMGGRVDPRWERRPPSWLKPTEETYGRLTSPLALLNYGSPLDLGARTVLGANMAVRRDVIATVGGFATHLGKRRGTLLSGEDADLCARVQAAGFRAVYDPHAVVEHWVPANRMRLLYFARWFFWSGITNAALEGPGNHGGRDVLGVPRYLIGRLAGSIAKAATATVTGRSARAVEGLVDVAFVAGYAAQRWGLTRVAPPSEPRGARV